MSTDVAEVGDVGAEVVVAVRGRRGLQRLRERHALDALQPFSSRRWRVLHPLVMSVSAGPPLVGLYLKPPLSGGLCDGVTTMPSASPTCGPRL
jgi:hypothetical protein